MPEFSGRLRAVGRVAILVSRYNELITSRLLEGALACCREAGHARARTSTSSGCRARWSCRSRPRPPPATGRYACLVALGAVIRGDTPHFEYVAGEAARGLGAVAVRHALPVGFGLLTVDTMEQAVDRAGGERGQQGLRGGGGGARRRRTSLAQLGRADAPD